jgi:hypothetical protein
VSCPEDPGDRALLAELLRFTGHIEDLDSERRLYLLSLLGGTLARYLGVAIPAPAAPNPELAAKQAAEREEMFRRHAAQRAAFEADGGPGPGYWEAGDI